MAFKQKVKGVPNKLEAWYIKNVMDPLLKAKKIKSYSYEAKAFVLARRTTYTPDIEVCHLDGTKEYIELKGSWLSKGAPVTRVKLKVAAAMYPEYKWKGVVVGTHKIKKEEIF